MKSRFSLAFRLLSCALLMAGLLCTLIPNSNALVGFDAKGVNDALRYGMKNSNEGLYTLLGPNWIEGPQGSLLNIYTPFMMIASKSARGGYSTDPTPGDIKKAKKRYDRTIRMYTRPINNDPPFIKFAVALYGPSEDFAYQLPARIEGVGRGKTFRLTPFKSIRTRYAKKVTGGNIENFEAINSYYFEFERIDQMDDFRLIIENPMGDAYEPIVFNVKTDRIY